MPTLPRPFSLFFIGAPQRRRAPWGRLAVAGLFALLGALAAVLAAGSARRAPAARAASALHPQLGFEVNRGQAPDSVSFLAHGSGYALGLGPHAVRLALGGAGGRAAAAHLRLTTPGGHLGIPTAGPALPEKVSYLIGKDRSRWLRDLPTFSRVTYARVWPGIDVAFQGSAGTLEYDFDVAPHADPHSIALALPGATTLRSDGHGGVLIGAHGQRLHVSAPTAYQNGPGGRSAVTSRLVVRGSQIRVALGRYDRARPLVVDPVFAFSTFAGGKRSIATGVGADASSNVYLAGNAASGDTLATTPGAAQPAYGGGLDDVFVEKLNASGTAVLYATYLGGANDDYAYGLAVDSTGSAYVTGTTNATNNVSSFPTTAGALQTSYGGGYYDGFVTKLNPAGTGLVYSTLLGGSGQDSINAIAVGSDGSAYLTGSFPNYHGCTDVATAKLNPSGSAISYWTCNPSAVGLGIAVDRSGDAYVTGRASSSMTTTSGVAQPAFVGGMYDNNAFVQKLNPAGSLAYRTFAGGGASATANANAIAIDPAGAAYITGNTDNTFPATAGAYQTADGGAGSGFGSQNAFVLKLSPSAANVAWATYLGGPSDAVGNGIAVDSAGHAYVTGQSAEGFPVSADAAQRGYAGGYGDAFLTELAPDGGSLVYSTYLGGSGQDSGKAATMVPNGNVAIAGAAGGPFPTTQGAADTTSSGGAFAAELGAPVAGGGGPTTGGGGTTTQTTPTGGSTTTPGPATTSGPQAPGFVETLTTSKGTTITIKTAQGQEPYAELDKHLLGGLSADDMARLIANGGFSVQIPLTYPAYPGNYSADGSASPAGIPGYDGQGVGSGSPVGYGYHNGAQSGRMAGFIATRGKRRDVKLFHFARHYARAGIYTIKIRLTKAGRRLLVLANRAHRSLKVKLRERLTATGHASIDRHLSIRLKPGKRLKARPHGRKGRPRTGRLFTRALDLRAAPLIVQQWG